MRKTIRNGIDRRAVYKFQCTGSCGRVKSTYVYDRAKKGVCLSCSKHAVDPNQSSLFPEGNFTQEHFEALNEANRQENERLDNIFLDSKPMPLVVNKSQKKVFDKAGVDTSNMVLNQPVVGSK